MRADLIAEIEALTGREVVAFLSDRETNSDTGRAVFVLGP
jgi:uncharacterized protein YbcI